MKNYLKSGIRFSFFIILSFVLFYFIFIFFQDFPGPLIRLFDFLFQLHPFLFPLGIAFFSLFFVVVTFLYIRFLYLFFKEIRAPLYSGVPTSAAGLGYRNLPLNLPSRYDPFPLVPGNPSEITNLSRVLDPVMLSDLAPYPHVPFHPEVFSDLQSLPAASTHFDFGKFFGFKDGFLSDYALEWAFVLEDRFTALEPQEVEWYYDQVRDEMRIPLGYISMMIRGKSGFLELQDEVETEAEFEEEMGIYQSSLPYPSMDQEGIGLNLPVFDLDSLISVTDDANSLVLKRLRADRFLSYRASDYLSGDEFRDIKFKARWKNWRWHPILNRDDRFGRAYINRFFVRRERHNLLAYRRLRRFATSQALFNARIRRTLRSKPALWTGFSFLEQSAFIDLINILSPFYLSSKTTHCVARNKFISVNRYAKLPRYFRYRPRFPQPSILFYYENEDHRELHAEFFFELSFHKPLPHYYTVFGSNLFVFQRPFLLSSFPKKIFSLFPSPADPYPRYTVNMDNTPGFLWSQVDDFVIFWLPFIIDHCYDFIGSSLRRARSLRLDSAGRFNPPPRLVPNDYRKSRFFRTVLQPVLVGSGSFSESGSLSHFLNHPSSGKRSSLPSWNFFFNMVSVKSVRNRLYSSLFYLGGSALLKLNREVRSDLSALGDSDLRHHSLLSRKSLGNLHFFFSAYRSRQNLALLFSLYKWFQRFGLLGKPLSFRSFFLQISTSFLKKSPEEFLPRSISDYFILEIYYFHLFHIFRRQPTFKELLRHFLLSKRSRKPFLVTPRYILDQFFYRSPLRGNVLRSFVNPNLRFCSERFDSRAWKELEPYSIVSHRAYHGGWYRSPFWEPSSNSFLHAQFLREVEPDSVGLRYFETFCTTLDPDDYLSVQQLFFDRLARSQLSIVADGRPLEYRYDARYFDNFRRYYLCQEIFKPWYQAYWGWRVLFEKETKQVLYAYNYVVRAWTQSLPLSIEGLEKPSSFYFSRSSFDEPSGRGRRSSFFNRSPVPVYEPNYLGQLPDSSFGRSRVLDLGSSSYDPFEDYLFDTLPLAARSLPSVQEFGSLFSNSHFVSQTYVSRDLSFPFFSRGFSEVPAPVNFFSLLSFFSRLPRSPRPFSQVFRSHLLFSNFRSFTGFLPFWFFRSQSLFDKWYAPRFPSSIPPTLLTSGTPVPIYLSALTRYFDTRSTFNAQDLSIYGLDAELFRATSLFKASSESPPVLPITIPATVIKYREYEEREEALDRHATLLSYYIDLFGPGPLSDLTPDSRPVSLSSFDPEDSFRRSIYVSTNAWRSTRGVSFPLNLFIKFAGPVFSNFNWLLGVTITRGVDLPFLLASDFYSLLRDHPDTQAVFDTLPRRRFNPDYRPSNFSPPSLTPEEYWIALRDLVLDPAANPQGYPYSEFKFYWERVYASFFFHYRFYGTFPDWTYSDSFPSFPELEPVRRIGTFLKEFSNRVRWFDPEMGLDPKENKKEPFARPALPSVPRLEDFGLESSEAAYYYRKSIEGISLYGLGEVQEYSVAEARYAIFGYACSLPLLDSLLSRYDLPPAPEDLVHYLVDPSEYRYPARSIRWLQSIYKELQSPSRKKAGAVSFSNNADYDRYRDRFMDLFLNFEGPGLRSLPWEEPGYDNKPEPALSVVSFTSAQPYALNRFKTLYGSLARIPFSRYYVERQKSYFQVLRPTLLFFRSDSFRSLTSYYAHRTNSQESEGGEYPFFFRNFLALDEANRYEDQDEDMEDDEEDEEIEILLTEGSLDGSEPEEFEDMEDDEELELELGNDEPYLYKETRARFYDWVYNPAVVNDDWWDYDFSNRRRRYYRSSLKHTTIGGIGDDEEHFGSTLFYYRGDYDEYIYWEEDDIDDQETDDDEQDTTHQDEESR